MHSNVITNEITYFLYHREIKLSNLMNKKNIKTEKKKTKTKTKKTENPHLYSPLSAEIISKSNHHHFQLTDNNKRWVYAVRDVAN